MVRVGARLYAALGRRCAMILRSHPSGNRTDGVEQTIWFGFEKQNMLRDDLRKITEKVFGESRSFEKGKEWTRDKANTLALCLRLEGRCSTLSISQALKRFGSAKYNSVGWVSEILQFACESLPNTLANEENGTKLVIMACGEIFSHLRPILMTVNPVSSAILKIELADSREASVWKEHWECIERSGYLAVYLVNDEGKSMSLAQKEVLSQVIRQSDTFHGLAHTPQHHKESRDSGEAQSVHALPQPSTVRSWEEERQDSQGDFHRQEIPLPPPAAPIPPKLHQHTAKSVNYFPPFLKETGTVLPNVKRSQFIKELVHAGCYLCRHGTRHDIYTNPKNGRMIRRCSFT